MIESIAVDFSDTFLVVVKQSSATNRFHFDWTTKARDHQRANEKRLFSLLVSFPSARWRSVARKFKLLIYNIVSSKKSLNDALFHGGKK